MENKNNTLSEKELREYFDKNTSSERRHALKQKMEGDSFLQEALEGYEAFPGEIENLGLIKKSIRKKLFKSRFNYAYLLVAPVAAVVVFLWIGKPDAEKSSEMELPLTESNEIQPVQDFDDVEKVEINSVEETRETVGTVKKNEVLNLSVKETNQKERLHIKAIDKIIPPLALTVENNGHQKVFKKKKNNFAVTYILDLKVADYSQRESGNRHQPNNLEARYEFGGETPADGNTTMVGYSTFLKETLEKFIAADYKTALANFKTIQKYYPNDVNAWFYAGLCHYKLGNYNAAKASFESAENYYINIFDEEAEWYRALSLEELDRKEELKPLLEKIISRESFYAEKAKKVLERN